MASAAPANEPKSKRVKKSKAKVERPRTLEALLKNVDSTDVLTTGLTRGLKCALGPEMMQLFTGERHEGPCILSMMLIFGLSSGDGKLTCEQLLAESLRAVMGIKETLCTNIKHAEKGQSAFFTFKDHKLWADAIYHGPRMGLVFTVCLADNR